MQEVYKWDSENEEFSAVDLNGNFWVADDAVGTNEVCVARMQGAKVPPAIAALLFDAAEQVLSAYNDTGDISAVEGSQRASDDVLVEISIMLPLYSLAAGGYQPKASQSWLDDQNSQMRKDYAEQTGLEYKPEDDDCQEWATEWEASDDTTLWCKIEALKDGTYRAGMSDANNYTFNYNWASYTGDSIEDAIACLVNA